jgi:hypothetical protein
VNRSEGPARSLTVETSAEGTLEEMDGTPIRPPTAGPAFAAVPWHRAMPRAAAAAAGRPRLWAYALAAFLARGGVVVLALPIVVLPTFIGIANVVGPASVSAAGPSPRLVGLIVACAAAVATLVVVGTLVAAAAETALHRATVTPDADTPSTPDRSDPSPMAGSPPGSMRRAVARVAALRLLLLVPVAAVTVVAVPAWIGVAYRELTLPSDVATPLVLRVVAGAPAASVAVLLAWLATEVVGGFATRRAVLLGASVPRALADGGVDPLRAPVGTVLTVAVALVLSVGLLLPAVWAVGAAWDAARRALVGEVDPIAALVVALALAAAWTVALLLAGIAAAARASLATAELLRRGPARGIVGVPGLAAPAAPARHAATGPGVR